MLKSHLEGDLANVCDNHRKLQLVQIGTYKKKKKNTSSSLPFQHASDLEIRPEVSETGMYV